MLTDIGDRIKGRLNQGEIGEKGMDAIGNAKQGKATRGMSAALLG